MVEGEGVEGGAKVGLICCDACYVARLRGCDGVDGRDAGGVETEGGSTCGDGIEDERIAGVKGFYDKEHVEVVGLYICHDGSF